MPKQPKVTSVADAQKLHVRCVAEATAVQGKLQINLYECVEKRIKDYIPGGHFDISGTFEGDTVLSKELMEEVAQRYQKAGWDTTFSNADGDNTLVTTNKVRFTLKPKKGSRTKK